MRRTARRYAVSIAYGCAAPCWSCEGYKYPDGSIQRVLQGRFTTRLRIYLRLIDDWLTRGMSKSGSCAPGA